MDVLLWILGATFSISLMAWVGLFFFQLREKLLEKILLPLVAFAAGALMGGAFLHLLPEAMRAMGVGTNVFLWILIGFTMFFLLEQFIQWHHCHRIPSKHQKSSSSYLILISGALHHLIGGLSIAGAFLVNIEAGIIAWIAAAAHELPQEFGDFGILIHGGWNKIRALSFNFLSSLTVILGGLIAYFISEAVNVSFLLPFAVGNFLYIAASDIIPEIKHGNTEACDAPSPSMKEPLIHFLSFLVGVGLMYGIKIAFNV